MSYDSWLFRQAEDYLNPLVDEVTIKGFSFFDVELKNGDVLKNVQMDYRKNMSLADGEDPIHADDLHIEDYFDLEDLDCFEISDNETRLDNWDNVKRIIGFSDGHSIDDLELEV